MCCFIVKGLRSYHRLLGVADGLLDRQRQTQEKNEPFVNYEKGDGKDSFWNIPR